jgi:putative RecB family exonuclease
MIQAPDYLSPSSIGTFQTCPLKFKFSRIDRIIDPPTEATVLGNFVHTALEGLFALPAEDRTLASARTVMREVWEQEWGEQAVLVLNRDREAIRTFRWKAWWCIENYFKLEDPTAFDPAGIETGLDGHVGRARVKGFIDRWEVDSNLQITISDYKTGKTPRPQWAGDKFQQLFIYAVLLRAETSIEVSQVSLLYLKDGTVLSRPVTEENLAEVTEEVESVYDSVAAYCEAGEFPAKKNKLCDWCSYKKMCPIWTKGNFK